MSVPTIASYSPFRRLKITRQSVLPGATESRIQAQPDKRYRPVCHGCGQKGCAVHSWAERTVRDLNLATPACGSDADTASCFVLDAGACGSKICSFFIRICE